MHTENIPVGGMGDDAHAAHALTGITRHLPGVEAAYASLHPGQVTVQYDEGQTSPTRLKRAIEKAGYFTGYLPLGF